MAIPFSAWYSSIQGFIALDVAGIGITAIANEKSISLLGTITTIA